MCRVPMPCLSVALGRYRAERAEKPRALRRSADSALFRASGSFTQGTWGYGCHYHFSYGVCTCMLNLVVGFFARGARAVAA